MKKALNPYTYTTALVKNTPRAIDTYETNPQLSVKIGTPRGLVVLDTARPLSYWLHI